MDDVFQEEEKHWQNLKHELFLKEQELDAEWGRKLAETKQFQQYLVDYKGEIDPHEMFTNSRISQQQQVAEAVSSNQLSKVKKIQKNPYFSRIDFQFSGDSESERIYIGRFSYTNSNGELLIYDWRAPISSMFYDYDFGPAAYQAPNGEVSGEIIGKRQIKIVDGEIDYVLESQHTIFDDTLQRTLSHKDSQHMSTIINTIQQEQNAIIRNTKDKSLILQGVAGSGKTSIALHRIAFMLYHFKDSLSSEEVMILSPNSVFSQYISQVLPELGEEPVIELTVEAFFEKLAGAVPVYSRIEESERLNDRLPHDALVSRIKRIHLSSFMTELDLFLKTIEKTAFFPEPIQIGEMNFSKAYIIQKYRAYHKHPILERFDRIAEDLLEEAKVRMPKHLPSRAQVTRRLKKCFGFRTTMQIYREFLKSAGIPAFKNLTYSDLFPIAYIRLFFEQIPDLSKIKYLVIDEMQDLALIQQLVIKQVFKCGKLLVGDFTQQIESTQTMTLQQLGDLFSEAKQLILTKSYRSTYEIMTFAKKIIHDTVIQPITRHGEDPQRIICKNKDMQSAQIISLLTKQAKQAPSVLLITRTLSEAREWYTILRNQGINLRLLDGKEATKSDEKIVISSLLIVKGLEADTVIGIDTQKEYFPGKIGDQQLFVIATRAINQLYFIERRSEDEN
ncbi:DNA helicase [Enterococcus florum]|uniref:DNA helicase n=1 Tax=Enterococcus florum TaxID=2480627 RepID=A0A4P5P708_9ENTE|nr:AAA family ATPase [Enterococcus florum]GCF93727.1 DNA helicase [Enterococcus florum]